MSVRKLVPGQAVRIEVPGHVVKQMDDNPYWYEISFDDGRPSALVSLARINAVNDRSRGVIDTDGSLQIFSPRLSALGGLDLLEWLRTNEQELRASAGIEQDSREVSPIVHKGYAPDGSNYHDHLCRCPGCDPQPPSEE